MVSTDFLKIDEYRQYKSFIRECSEKRYDSSLVLHIHHIIPKCLTGSNAHSNLVMLSVEDHIHAHMLLAKCFDLHSYEYLSNLRSARLLNKNSILLKTQLDEIRAAYSGSNNPFYGRTHSTESREKMSVSQSGRLKGKNYEHQFGLEKASVLKDKKRVTTTNQWSEYSSEKLESVKRKISLGLKGNVPWNKGLGAKIKINGLEFNSLKLACEHFKTSLFLLKKNFIIERI